MIRQYLFRQHLTVSLVGSQCNGGFQVVGILRSNVMYSFRTRRRLEKSLFRSLCDRVMSHLYHVGPCSLLFSRVSTAMCVINLYIPSTLAIFAVCPSYCEVPGLLDALAVGDFDLECLDPLLSCFSFEDSWL